MLSGFFYFNRNLTYIILRANIAYLFWVILF